jgi:hypothetical protein
MVFGYIVNSYGSGLYGNWEMEIGFADYPATTTCLEGSLGKVGIVIKLWSDCVNTSVAIKMKFTNTVKFSTKNP